MIRFECEFNVNKPYMDNDFGITLEIKGTFSGDFDEISISKLSDEVKLKVFEKINSLVKEDNLIFEFKNVKFNSVK